MEKHTISFKNAFRGLGVAVTTQLNLKIHFVVATLVLATGLFLELNLTEWLIITLTIGMVIVAELINTAVEFGCNAITREHNEDIKHAKDISAGAVLFAATLSVIIGLLIFLPKILSLGVN